MTESVVLLKSFCASQVLLALAGLAQVLQWNPCVPSGLHIVEESYSFSLAKM